LLTLLDAYQPGHLAPMLRAERDLARARVAASDGDPSAAAAFAAAISNLRELSTPYHLAHGLLDHTEYLTRDGDAEAGRAGDRGSSGHRGPPTLPAAAGPCRRPDPRKATGPGLNARRHQVAG
jgi:hypothetical protein